MSIVWAENCNCRLFLNSTDATGAHCHSHGTTDEAKYFDLYVDEWSIRFVLLFSIQNVEINHYGSHDFSTGTEKSTLLGRTLIIVFSTDFGFGSDEQNFKCLLFGSSAQWISDWIWSNKLAKIVWRWRWWWSYKCDEYLILFSRQVTCSFININDHLVFLFLLLFQ